MNLPMQLRHKVQIQERSASTDDFGQPLESWNTIASPWADIRNLNGLETVKGGADTSVVRASIRIRYRTGLSAAMRVVHGATTYQINAVLPEEQGRVFLDLACEVIE